MDKSSANSVESTHGSSGAAKYLINQLHLRPVETTRGIEAPKILPNSNHGPSMPHQGNSHSFSGNSHGQMIGQRGIGDKLRPLLEGSRFAQPSSKGDQQI